MYNSREYEFQYPIFLKQERSHLYKKISFIVACLAILMIIALVVALFLFDYKNVSKQFIWVPIIAIIALVNFGNCDEIVTLQLSAEGFSINSSIHPYKNQKLEWQEIVEIEPPTWDGGDWWKISVRLRNDGTTRTNEETKITEFLDLGETGMYRLLKWHWAKNTGVSD